MENVALSMSVCLSALYPAQAYLRPLFLIGPGNNGGDGLSVARLMASMGYLPTILVPVDVVSHRFQHLIGLCSAYGIPILSSPSLPDDASSKYSMIVDALFGFSFKGPTIREPYASLLGALSRWPKSTPLVSLDVPSGWLVDETVQPLPVCSSTKPIEPDCLISLTLPKLCARGFSGKWHVLCGGHFVPRSLQQALGIAIPEYGDALYLIL